MTIKINNEIDTLKKVVVCWGNNIPIYEEYKTDDPEFLKYHPNPWDKNLLLKQQEGFFKALEKYQVTLVFPKMEDKLFWQMYTRDTAFVVADKLYYSNIRKLEARNGEVSGLLKSLDLPEDKIVKLEGETEGGDVLVNDRNQVYIGKGSRTNKKAIEELESKLDNVKVFDLGENVMHLDTRLTILPKNIALIYSNSFKREDLEFLSQKYQLIEVTEQETNKLGTNVLVVNPETVFMPLQHKRVASELEKLGLRSELIDYTEPINLGGSFRCTTLPLVRDAG